MKNKVLEDLPFNYKIEKWNKGKQTWEHCMSFVLPNEAILYYRLLLKNNVVGIYRLIKLMQIDEV